MSLHLTSTDVARYQATSDVLVSSLEFCDPSAWCMAVLDAVGDLFGVDRSMLVYPVDGEARAHSDNIDPDGLRKLQGAVSMTVPGGFRSSNSAVASVLQSRRAAGLDVWHNEALAEAAGISLESIPFYHEAMVPNGVTYGSGMVATLPGGEAWLSIAHTRPSRDRFGVGGTLQLLRMLHPSFAAGASALAENRSRRESIQSMLHAMDLAVVIFDADGRERFRSRSVRKLLSRHAESKRLLADIRQLCSTVLRLRRKTFKSEPDEIGRPLRRTVSTTGGMYELSAVRAPSDLVWGPGGVVVRVDEVAPSLPSRAELGQRFGLTPREADVALLLARGGSNLTIADHLGISHHTVRTHVEHIFAKLGIHSRNALALTLMTRDEKHGS